MSRNTLLALFAFAVTIIVFRQKFTHSKTIHHSLEGPTNVNGPITDKNNYYRTGQYNISQAPIPQATLRNPLGVLDVLRSRKKINSYMFTQYNIYKFQVIFIDLSYASTLQINYWSEDLGSIHLQQKIGFSLDEDFHTGNLNLHIEKAHFNMTVRQTKRLDKLGNSQIVTSFNISLINIQNHFYANYTHVLRQQQCMTAVRNAVISHKCYGGYGYGKVRIEQTLPEPGKTTTTKKTSAFNPQSNTTRCSFDGLRGNGWNWKWVWIYGTGFSKPQFYLKNHKIQKQRWIGFNFGSLYDKSQDFLFLNGKIYPIEGLQYTYDENVSERTNITFTAKNPIINMNFLAMHNTKYYQDMGIMKVDMVKSQGHWEGYLMDPQDPQQKIKFYQISGLIQTADSIF